MQCVFKSRRAETKPASDIFVVNGTTGADDGVTRLIGLMDSQRLHFFRSRANPSGLISQDEVVIIKVNCQWDERGGTNTDLLRLLIAAIVRHPDGFTGEVIVADNGQAQYGSTGRGGSFDYTGNNAEDITQSVSKVVNAFGGHRVSAYLWDAITTTRVKEYSEGDDRDGYVVADSPNPRTGALVSYPKFRTAAGTCISFKHGIWDPKARTYDAARPMVINMPVLKSHFIYGVTATVKHYQGVVSDKLTAQLGARAHITVAAGGLGTEMAETRFPVLNIIDAIWVNARPQGGPGTRYDAAERINVIVGGTDPVALDYWAAKHILMQVAREKGYDNIARIDPDNVSPRSFGHWLRLSMEEIKRAGYPTAIDELRMSVHVSEAGSPRK